MQIGSDAALLTPIPTWEFSGHVPAHSVRPVTSDLFFNDGDDGERGTNPVDGDPQ